MISRISVLSALVLIALSVAGCRSGGEQAVVGHSPAEDTELKIVAGETGKFGGSLIQASISDPRTFNPIVASETSSTEILNHIFAGLVERDGRSLEMMPALAAEWKTSDDGLVWTFRLRRGLQWSDGMPLTSDDVIFTYNDLIYNPDIPNSSADILKVDGRPIKVEKVDDLTIRMSMSKPFAPLLNSLTGPILPRHKLHKAVEAGNFSSTWGVHTPPHEIVGNGPFVLQRFLPAQKVVLARNPYYWKADEKGRRLPYLDGWVYAIVPDLDAMLLKFQAKQTDVVSVRGSDYAMLARQEKARNFTIYDLGPTFGTEMLFFNMNPRAARLSPLKRQWFSDGDFRRAIAHAVDKESIISSVYNGLAVPLIGPESTANRLFHNPDVPVYDYNHDKARRMLAEAGYTDKNGDGFIQDRAGNTISFTIITNSGNNERQKMGSIIRDDLARLGMKVTLAPISFNDLVNKLTGTFDWDACILGFTGGLEPHSGRNFWHSSGQLHVWHPTQSKPATAWEAEIDRLFDQAAVTIDPDKRRALYFEFQQTAVRELPIIYLVTPTRKVAVRNRFGNLEPTVSGALWNEWQIYVR